MAFLKKQYQQLRNFFKADFSYFLFITTAAFLLLTVMVFIFGLIIPESAERFVDQFLQKIADLGIVGEDNAISAVDLFFNNFRGTLISVVYGFIPLIYLSALSLGINASMLGIVGAYYVNNGTSLWYYLMGILPHGIFELPALILALASGLYLCRCMTLRLIKKRVDTVNSAACNCLRVFFMLITPLLLIAAFVETNITPLILKLFL